MAPRAASLPSSYARTIAGSSAGARTSTPCGASHNNAGRAPCQRTANADEPARRGTESTVSDLAEPIGRVSGQQLDRARKLAHEHVAQRGEEPGRVERRIRRPYDRPGISGAGPPARAAAVPPSEAGPPERGFVVEAPVFERGNHSGLVAWREQQVGSGRVDHLADRRRQPRLQTAFEVAVPAARHGVGARQVPHVDRHGATIGLSDIAECRAHACAVRNREQQRDLDRCGLRLERTRARGPARDDLDRRRPRGPGARRTRHDEDRRAIEAHHRTVDLYRASTRQSHDERDRERNRRPVLDLDDHDRAARRDRAVAPVHHISAGHPHERLGRRRRAGAHFDWSRARRPGCATGRRPPPTNRARDRRPRRHPGHRHVHARRVRANRLASRSLHPLELRLGLAHHELGNQIGGTGTVVEHASDERRERHLDVMPVAPARAPPPSSSPLRPPCSSRSPRRRARDRDRSRRPRAGSGSGRSRTLR